MVAIPLTGASLLRVAAAWQNCHGAAVLADRLTNLGRPADRTERRIRATTQIRQHDRLAIETRNDPGSTGNVEPELVVTSSGLVVVEACLVAFGFVVATGLVGVGSLPGGNVLGAAAWVVATVTGTKTVRSTTTTPVTGGTGTVVTKGVAGTAVVGGTVVATGTVVTAAVDVDGAVVVGSVVEVDGTTSGFSHTQGTGTAEPFELDS